MNEQDFQTKLSELIEQIDDLPAEHREKLSSLAAETQERHERIRKAMGSLQESLDYLRLSVKYLVFDLEATRRENQTLRVMLENGGEMPDNSGVDDADPAD